MKNTFVKVLSMMMALMMIVGILTAIPAYAADDECDHVPAGEPVVVKPTCSTIGYSKYQCAICEEEYIDDVKPANEGHNYVKVPEKPATCTTNKVTEGWECADCHAGIGANTENKTAPTEVPNSALGHKWGTYEKYFEKTCTTGAYTTVQCVRCDAWDTENKSGKLVIDTENPASHEFIYKVDAPTTSCTDGQVTITCADCDYKDVIVEDVDHHWVKMDTRENTTGTALEKQMYAGSECFYTYMSGWYCDKCWNVKDTVLLANGAVHNDDELNVDGTGDDKYFGDTLTTSNINKEIAALTNPKTGEKFKVGDVTFVAATCTTDGWHLSYCSVCKQYNVKVDAHPEDGHDLGDWTPWTSATVSGVSFPEGTKAAVIEAGQYHRNVFKKTQSCEVCHQVVNTETTVASNHNYDNVEEGDKFTDVFPATCTVNGFTKYTCRYGCGEWHTGDVVIAKGDHSWNDNGWTKVQGFVCESATAKLERFCTNPECDTAPRTLDNAGTAGLQKERQEKTDTTTKHDYKLDPIAGTCVEADKYQEKCANCGTTRAYTGDKKPDGSSIKPNNHVAKVGDATTYTQIGSIKQNYTCTTDEITYYVCKCGQRVELVTRKADGHNMITGGVDEKHATLGNIPAEYHAHDAGAACNKDCKNFEPVASTCFEQGQSAGKLCIDCGYAEVPSQKLPLDPNNHGNYDKLNYVEVPANCSSVGKMTWNCAKCFVKVEKNIINDTQNNQAVKNPNLHNNMKFVPQAEANCVNAGMKAHYVCEDCNNYYSAATLTGKVGETDTANKVTKASLVIAGTATHTWSDAIVVKYETCDAIGFEAFKFCTDCQDATTLNEAQYANVKTIQLQNATLDVVVDNPATNKAGENEAYNAIVRKAHGLKYTKNWSYLVERDANGVRIPASCTKGAWKDTIPTNSAVCVYCALGADRTVTDKYVGTDAAYWEAAKNHNDGAAVSTLDRYNLVEVGGVWKAIDCTDATYERVQCSICKETWLDNYTPAINNDGHDFPKPNAEGKYADADKHEREATCVKDGAWYIICADCGAPKDIEVIKAEGHYVMQGTTKTPITFECEDLAKFKGLTCNGCNEVVGSSTKYPVVHNPITVKVDATCTTDGYEVKYCKDCGEQYPANTKYDHAKGHDYGYGGEGQPTKLLVAETAAAWTYRCHVCGQNYNVAKPAATPDSVASTTYSVEKIAAGETVDVIVKVSGKALTYNAAIVTLNFNADKFEIVKATAGDAKAITACGEKKVSIFVPNDVDGNAQTAAVAADGTVVVTVTLQAKRYANGAEKISATVLFNEGTNNADTAEATEQKKSVTIAGLGNLNGDALFTAEDAIAIHGMISEDYNATADVNGDGVVNMADAIAVAKYAASNKKASDFLKMIGEYDKIEEIVFAMYEDGKLADMDGDRVILINDAYALINKIEEKINAADSFSYNSVEELVYAVMTAKA